MGDLRQSAGWHGRCVVPFEQTPPSGSDRNALVFETPRTMASGSYIGALIRDRQDRARAKHRRAPRQLQLTILLRQDTLDAMAWARDRGFTEAEVPYAAPMAVLLRRVLGKGNVKAAMVREQCEKRYPHIFGKPARERVAREH